MSEDAGLEDRVERLEGSTGRIERMLEQVLGGAQAKAEQRQEEHLSRPTETQEMVRMELRKAKEEQEAADKAAAKDSEFQQVKDTVAKMTEAKPVQPIRRITKLMWDPPR